MKRLLLLIILISIYSSNIIAQDLIVTKHNDSINCKITIIKKKYIYFTYKSDDEYKNTLITRDDITAHQLDFYKKVEVPIDKVVGYEEFKRFRVILEGGLSFRTAGVSQELPAEFQKYAKDLRKGFHLGGELGFFFNTSFGVGFRGSWSKASNSMGSIYIEDEEGNREYGVMRDRISMVYLGPSFLLRHINSKNDNEFCFGVGMGYMSYKNDAVLIDNFVIKGNTLAMTLDFSYYIALNKTSAIGFKAALISGSLFNVEIDNGTTVENIHLEKDQFIGLSRIDLSVGFKFGY